MGTKFGKDSLALYEEFHPGTFFTDINHRRMFSASHADLTRST